MDVSVERGGTGSGPTLVLLHGLGATGAVWRGVLGGLTGRWPGAWVVPDLPGHGRSAALPRYSFGALAASVASVLDGPVAVLGHSLGGVVGLTLASGWFGVPVTAVCGLGIKLRWSEDDLGRAGALASRPNRVFDTREEAVGRAHKIAGLATRDEAFAATAVVADGQGWRPALDPGAFGVGAPDVDGLIGTSKAPVRLAAGEHDPMCPAEHLRAADPDGVVLAGLGHNAHVEDPSALWPLLDALAGRA